jgi:hypothetical protein
MCVGLFLRFPNFILANNPFKKTKKGFPFIR